MPGQNFDRAAGIYDATRGWPPGVAAQIGAELYQALAPFAQPGQRLRVIEAGAGTGRVLLPLAEAGAWTVGVDISAGMLGVLREKAAGNLGVTVRVVRGDASRLPFAAGAFDAGLMVHVLHLVDSWRPVLAGIERIVRPGGALAFGRDEHDYQGETWLDTRWTARLAEAGWAPQERGRSAITTDAADLLAAAGYTRREMVLATWTTERTPESYLRSLRDRYFSSTWNVPDPVMEPAVARLTEDILDHYGRLDITLPRHNQFRLILLHRPG